jgi:hypothetical protein
LTLITSTGRPPAAFAGVAGAATTAAAATPAAIAAVAATGTSEVPIATTRLISPASSCLPRRKLLADVIRP